jgi:hypothetical protein
MTTPEDISPSTVTPAATPAVTPELDLEPQSDVGNIGTGPVHLASGRTLAESMADTSGGDYTSTSGIHQSPGWFGKDPEWASAYQAAGSNIAAALGGVKSFVTQPTAGDIARGVPAQEAAARSAEVRDDLFNQWASDYGEADGGITTGGRVTLVGESGPEVALFPNGTEIIPLDRDMKPDQKRRLRRRGVRGMQEGGLVFDREPSRGISQFLGGREVGPSQGRLFRRAGFTTPSAQALRNILPEELEEFRAMGARARIPEGTFERELAQGIASGTRSSNSARFLPLSLRS